MRVRLLIAAFAACVLASCGPPERQPSAEAEAKAAAPSIPGAATPNGVPQRPETPAPEAAPSFVGMWAVDRRLCNNPAFRFEAREVSTLGEVHCDFNTVTPRANGYSIAASCTAEAPPAPFTIDLAMSTAPRAMTISGGPWEAGTRLVYCGELTEE